MQPANKHKIYILQCAHNITMIVKDASVLIHLAKISVLEKSCDYFRKVIIPKLVYEEIIKGKEKGYEDTNIIDNLIKIKKIIIKEIKEEKLIKKANEFNIQGGEAEALALYWQEEAHYLATDDDNLRKRQTVLNIAIIGTPSIIINLYKKQQITKEKYLSAIKELSKIGWFSNQVLDKMKMEER